MRLVDDAFMSHIAGKPCVTLHFNSDPHSTEPMIAFHDQATKATVWLYSETTKCYAPDDVYNTPEAIRGVLAYLCAEFVHDVNDALNEYEKLLRRYTDA